VLFVLGLVSMLCGVIAAMMELRGALQPVEFEERFMSDAVEPTMFESKQEEK
jgi:hypothetical protein